MTRLSLLILLASLTPAAAQDQQPPNLATTGQGTQGGVARLVFAHQLYAYGTTNKDPLTVLNAARLAASVTVSDTARTAEPTVDIAPISTQFSLTPTAMFDAAAILAAENEALLDLIDTNRRQAPYAPTSAVVSSSSTLASAQTATWPVPFFGAVLAEAAILGNGANNLDLTITDESGNLICQDVGPSDTAYCSFYPAQNGIFQITVSNVGKVANSYFLLTN